MLSEDDDDVADLYRLDYIRVTTRASATTVAYPAQIDDIQAPCGSIIDKTLCYAHAL